MNRFLIIVQRGIYVLLALPFFAVVSGYAHGKHEKNPPAGISLVHEDGGRLDLIRDPERDDDINFIGQIVGKYKYLIVRRPGDRAFIAAYYKGRHLFSVPDYEIADIASDWKPGVASNGYDFYMSPDRRYLFVDRALVSDLDVGLLYKKSKRGWITAGSVRFDDAALQAYCRYRHLDPDKLSGPSRSVRLNRWDLRHGRLYFWMSAASFWFSDEANPGDLAVEWTGSCRLRDMHFQIISDKVYRIRKPGWIPR